MRGRAGEVAESEAVSGGGAGAPRKRRVGLCRSPYGNRGVAGKEHAAAGRRGGSCPVALALSRGTRKTARVPQHCQPSPRCQRANDFVACHATRAGGRVRTQQVSKPGRAWRRTDVGGRDSAGSSSQSELWTNSASSPSPTRQ